MRAAAVPDRTVAASGEPVGVPTGLIVDGNCCLCGTGLEVVLNEMGDQKKVSRVKCEGCSLELQVRVHTS